MPEGDTIFRAAASLERWMGGRTVTAARSQVLKVPVSRVIGQRIERFEARAKHLLVHLASGDVVHTHMRMTGSWHVYTAGDRWRMPGFQARLVLEAGDRLAVCFNAPVVELLSAREAAEHPSLSTLGPDVLRPPVDVAEVRRRAALRPGGYSLGELLLDQRIVSGIGNIYRCESLFLERRSPWTPQSALVDDELDALVRTAARIMMANLEPARGFGRDFGEGPDTPYVYGRTGRPCLRCGTAIQTTTYGELPRQVWWCPTCQSGWLPPP